MNWDKEEFNFGIVKRGSTHFATFKYLGDRALTNSNFTKSCGCTDPVYDPETRVLTVGLNMGGSIGSKNTTVTVHSNTREFLQLKATVQ